MKQQTHINTLLNALINPDFSIELDSSVYKQQVSDYECMLLHLISLSDTCIENKLLEPSVVLFDYNNCIICNQKFTITHNVQPQFGASTNFRLDLIKDSKNDRIYYMLQEKENPSKVTFHHLCYSIHFSNFNHIDISKIVSHIAEEHLSRSKYETLNFDLQLHHIDFKTGYWNIHKP
jgi:hypothetical protein